jgi:hypothetical protein
MSIDPETPVIATPAVGAARRPRINPVKQSPVKHACPKKIARADDPSVQAFFGHAFSVPPTALSARRIFSETMRPFVERHGAAGLFA